MDPPSSPPALVAKDLSLTGPAGIFGSCLEEAYAVEQRQAANLKQGSIAVKQVMKEITGNDDAELVNVTTVDGRILCVIDGAVPMDLVRHFYGCVQGCAFRNTEFARPDTRDFKHCIAEHNPSEICQTHLWPIIRRLVALIFPMPSGAEPLDPYRVYTNAVTYSDVAFVHRDSGDHEHVTILMYPNLDWAPELGGETVFYTEDGHIAASVSPKPGRLAIFHGSIMHKGSPPGRLFYGQRYTMAFKLSSAERRPPADRVPILDPGPEPDGDDGDQPLIESQ